MQNQMLSIFKAITPDNIKDLPIINDSMEIFIELLSENATISRDIKTALSEDTTESIEEELPKIYLYDYYSMIENLRTDKSIVAKFRRWNEALNPQIYPIGMPVIGERLVVDYFMIGQEGGVLEDDSENNGEDENAIKWNISPLSGKLDKLQENILKNKAENYYINRKFKESKGLKKSIFFIYDILNEHIVNPDERIPLEITETENPFEFQIISGSMDREIYKQSVAYLAHPLGFTYEYRYISELNFKDEYGLRRVYVVNMLEVRCLEGNIEKYTMEVSYIEERIGYLRIVFIDGSYLVQENNMVKYFTKDGTIIKTYPPNSHCSIYLDYKIEYRIIYNDDMKIQDTDRYSEEKFKIDDELTSRETIKIKRGFVIGHSTIGEEYISDDVEAYEYNDIMKIQDTDRYSEEKFKIDDKLNLSETIKIRRGFIIGHSSIDDDYISDDAEVYETVNIKERFIPPTVDDSVYSNDEEYNIMNAGEDFSIEII